MLGQLSLLPSVGWKMSTSLWTSTRIFLCLKWVAPRVKCSLARTAWMVTKCATSSANPLISIVDSSGLESDLLELLNSAFYLQRDGKWILAYRLRSKSLSLIAAIVGYVSWLRRMSSCSLSTAVDGCIARCSIISLC